MAKVLLIRDISDAANAALDRYKQEHGLKSNTDAAEAMMKAYYTVLSESRAWEKHFFQANAELNRIKSAHQKHIQAQEDFQNIIQGKETKTEEKLRQRSQALVLDRQSTIGSYYRHQNNIEEE